MSLCRISQLSLIIAHIYAILWCTSVPRLLKLRIHWLIGVNTGVTTGCNL